MPAPTVRPPCSPPGPVKTNQHLASWREIPRLAPGEAELPVRHGVHAPAVGDTTDQYVSRLENQNRLARTFRCAARAADDTEPLLKVTGQHAAQPSASDDLPHRLASRLRQHKGAASTALTGGGWTRCGQPFGSPGKPQAPGRRASDGWISECYDCRHDLTELVREPFHHLLASEPC